MVSVASLIASFGIAVDRFAKIRETASNVTCNDVTSTFEEKEMEKRADLTFALLVMWTSG